MKEFVISRDDAGQRVDRFLEKTAPLLAPSLCQKYIRKKRVKANGKAVNRDYRLVCGDVLSVYINDEFFSVPTPENAYLSITAPKLDIIYEDTNIILLDKKPGVLVHDAEGASRNTLITNVQAYLFQNGGWNPDGSHSFAPALCNRIDRNTGGIVIAAKNADALRIVNEKIKNREISKYYLCVTHNAPTPESGVLESQLFKDASKNKVYIKNMREKGTKTAVTEYRTLQRKNNLTLLELKLITGRTHQIRAQLAHIGCPLLGDGKYGNAAQGSKQALYSYKLAFDFKTPADGLEYLKNRVFSVSKVEFAEKYFDYDFMH